MEGRARSDTCLDTSELRVQTAGALDAENVRLALPKYAIWVFQEPETLRPGIHHSRRHDEIAPPSDDIGIGNTDYQRAGTGLTAYRAEG